MKPNTDTISLSEYADKLEHQQIKELEDKIITRSLISQL